MTLSLWFAHLSGVLWQAAWQTAGVLVVARMMMAYTKRPASRATLAHAALTSSLLSFAAALALPHYVLRVGGLPGFIPFVESAGQPSKVGIVGGTMTVLGIVWLLGAGCLLTRLLGRWWLTSRLVARAQPITSRRLKRLLRRVDPELPIEVRTLNGLSGAFCWQMHRPILVLPTNTLKLHNRELELLLRHEVAHVRFGDSLRLLVEQLAVALFWFHPMVHGMARRASRLREFACDDWVIASGGSPRRYVDCLVQSAFRGTWQQSAEAMLAFAGVPSDFADRIDRIMTGQYAPAQGGRIALRMAASFLAVCALALAMARVGTHQSEQRRAEWTQWPRGTAYVLDALNLQVTDFDLRRYAHAAREQDPEHRQAHRRKRSSGDQQDRRRHATSR